MLKGSEYLCNLQAEKADPISSYGDLPSSVSEDYRALPRQRFLERCRDTRGSWLFVDREGKFFLTSPEFSGAYWDTEQNLISNELGALLERRASKGLPIIDGPSLEWSISKECGVAALALPHATPFRGIRLLSASTCSDGWAASGARTYLSGRAEGTSFSLFEAAMMASAHRLSRSADGEIILPFSGGKDCLAVFLALREAGQESRVRCIFVDHLFFGGNRKQAEAVAAACGIDLHVHSPKGGWAYGDAGGSDRLEGILERNLSNATSPQHALAGDGALIVDGQNMDALLSFHMQKPPQQVTSWRSKATDSMYLLRNYKYLAACRDLGDTRMHERVNRVINALGVVQRIRGRPGLRRPYTDFQEFAADVLVDMKADQGAARDAFGRDFETAAAMFGDGGSMRGLFYYYYPSWQVLLGGSVPGSKVIRFPNMADFSGLWTNAMTWRDLVEPKWQVRRFIRKYASVKYDEIRFDNASAGAGFSDLNTNFFVRGVQGALESPLLGHLSDEKRRAFIPSLQDMAVRLANGKFQLNDLLWAMRIINHNLLLRRYA